MIKKGRTSRYILVLSISYNLSWKLKDSLSKIENLRVGIAIASISPKIKLRLRWETIISRIYYSLRLFANPLESRDLMTFLSKSRPKKIQRKYQEVIRYKRAFDYLLENWLGENRIVRPEDLITLHSIIGSGKLSKPKQELQNLLDYLQVRQESPIIQAAIVSIELMKMHAFTDKNESLSLLVPYLFLYKGGYDFRRLVSVETEFGQDQNYYKQNYNQAINASTNTVWLEYYAKSILTQVEKIYQSITKPNFALKEMKESFFELNERQKSILSILDYPQASLTNVKVQKGYNVSQITASRDLAKLTTLGFLFSHGKGRSVYYTKI